MKKIILCIAWVSCAFVTNAQNTGIGTTTPVARLHVTDSNVVFTGPSTLGATTLYPPPIQGAGSRMMWYPQKAAFRAGIVNGPQWDKDNIGRFSFAVGSNSWATGEGSFATGSISEARGDLSTAMGTSYASGQNSTALGNSNASGPYSTALGVSFASGESSTAAGYSSASGNFAFAGGASHAIAPSSTAFGYDTWAKAGGGVALGVFNDISDNPNPNVLSPTDRLFQIGNGTGSIRSNALTVLRSGNTGIGTTNPAIKLHVSGGASGGMPYGGAQVGIENADHTYMSMISPDAFETGIILGKASSTVSGGIFYNNPSTLDGLQFRTNGNQTRMVINSVGNVGIGTEAPFSPLTFNNTIGQKISFYGNTSNNYGFGIQGGLLQIHSGAAGDDIAFGYGSSSSFTETVRIKGNGNVGIGNNNPQFSLDVNGAINLTGPLIADGSQGTEKQVLSSTGTSSSWKTIGSLIQTYYKYAPNLSHFEGTVTGLSPNITMSAISHTITVNTKSRLIITASFYGSDPCIGICTLTGRATVDMRINGVEFVPGVFVGLTELLVPPTSVHSTGISNIFYDVNPGTYTIEFFTQAHSGAGFNLWSKYSTIIVLPID